MKRYLLTSCIIVSMLSLTGCLSPVKSQAPTKYLIDTVSEPKIRRSHRITLLVSQPETSRAFDTSQMAYSLYPHHVAFFANNRWAETPSQMLMPLIAQSLEETHYFRAVMTPPFVGYYDYVLYTQILTLQQDYSLRPVGLELLIRSQLFSMRTNRVVATCSFYTREPMRQLSPYGGVVAANMAVNQWLQELTAFTIRNAR